MDDASKKSLANLLKVLVFILVLLVFVVGYRYSLYVKFYEYRYGDIDGDGKINLVDEDVDGDGLDNFEDDDADGDGKPNLEDVLDEASAFASAGYHAAPFSGWLQDVFRKMHLFSNIDGVLVPFEKAGLYIGLEGDPRKTNPFSIQSGADLHDHIEDVSGFYTTRNQFDLPALGDIAFFHTGICGIVVGAKNITVRVFLCEKQIGVGIRSVAKMKNNSHILKEYGVILPEE